MNRDPKELSTLELRMISDENIRKIKELKESKKKQKQRLAMIKKCKDELLKRAVGEEGFQHLKSKGEI